MPPHDFLNRIIEDLEKAKLRVTLDQRILLERALWLTVDSKLEDFKDSLGMIVGKSEKEVKLCHQIFRTNQSLWQSLKPGSSEPTQRHRGRACLRE